MILTGTYDTDIAKYIPGTLDFVFQGMLEDIDTKEQPAYISYKDMENLDFQIMVTNNYYANPNSMDICFPMKIKQKSDKDIDINADLITVNIFFANLIKEINMTRYGNDKQLMPIFSPYEIYQYFDAMLKHLPNNAFKKTEKTVLYSKQLVYFNKTMLGQRLHNSNIANDITDLNINERITKFQNQLKNEFVYKVPLRYFTDIGKINFCLKIDFRIKFHLETDMKKLFELKKKVTATGAADAKIIFIRAPFLQYEQFLLDKNFRQYLETIMVSKKILRMSIQKTPIQKTDQMSVGSDSITIDFLGSNRQFDWLEIPLVFDKSYKHTTIYDNYNVELAAKYIKSMKLTNFTEIYSLTNGKKCGTDNLMQKHLLYKQFVA